MNLRVLLLSLILTGCGTNADDNISLTQGLNFLRGEQAEFVPRFTTLLRNNAPNLQVGVVETGSNSNLLLERQNGAFAYWLTSDGAQLVLENGMLHSTHGFGEGLLASELSEPLALVRNMQAGWSDRFQTYLYGNDRAATRTYRCLIGNEGRKVTELASGTVNTVLMTESCRSLDQKFLNFYWVVPSARQIVLSRQWAGPEVGQISIRVVPR